MNNQKEDNIQEKPNLELQDNDLQEETGELYEYYHWIVDKGQTPVRIDKFLTHRIENASRTKVQAVADAGNILVNGRSVKSNYKVKPLDEISVVMPHPPRELTIIPQDIPINIVYEDDHIIVINKEAGMVVHPGHGNYTGTLVNALTFYLKDLPLFQSGEMRPGLVHRIDKDTSGILVVAKTEYALNHLARQFFEHTIERKYLALVWGNLSEDAGTITGHIGRNPKDRMQMWVFEDGSDGKHAVTHYRVVERLGYVTLVECQLETGRTHQIRTHFRHMGHPLFNDARYGGDEILRGTTFTKYKQFVNNCFVILPRQALHARSLAFDHPVTRERMYFESELPEDMEQVIEKWRKYTQSRDIEISE
ncbi:MAG: RluA family pseudouridine synthase [Bacteroidales bacterium]|jgi:23S rRNA pseudouridine1911/1915/1917 synthase|nr:RluA family pseudouridine synthase [Bacteroidales bacterium]